MAVVTKEEVEILVSYLKLHSPVDTGNLRNNGIGGVQVVPKGYLIQIGFPQSVEGNPPTQSYAIYTQIKNKSSKGWVTRAIQGWVNDMRPLWEARKEGDINNELL